MCSLLNRLRTITSDNDLFSERYKTFVERYVWGKVPALYNGTKHLCMQTALKRGFQPYAKKTQGLRQQRKVQNASRKRNRKF